MCFFARSQAERHVRSTSISFVNQFKDHRCADGMRAIPEKARPQWIRCRTCLAAVHWASTTKKNVGDVLVDGAQQRAH